MRMRRDGSLVLVVCGLVAILIACIDPLEGFPLVLGGGLLLVVATRRAARPWFPLAAWGLALATIGTAVLLVLSAMGGVGGNSGRPAAWMLLAAPYPVGALLLLCAGALSIGRTRGAARRR